MASDIKQKLSKSTSGSFQNASPMYCRSCSLWSSLAKNHMLRKLLFFSAVFENDATYMQYFSLNSDATGSNNNSPLFNVSGFSFA